MQMHIPIGIFKALGSFGYNLYTYFYKGAKVDAALTFQKYCRYSRGLSEKNPADRAILPTEAVWKYEVSAMYSLTIKNNSKNPAYNIQLVNADDIFYSYDKIDKLTHLDSGGSININVEFMQSIDATGRDVERLPSIPDSKLGKSLIISYQNEARSTFYTVFIISEKDTINSYSIKRP